VHVLLWSFIHKEIDYSCYWQPTAAPCLRCYHPHHHHITTLTRYRHRRGFWKYILTVNKAAGLMNQRDGCMRNIGQLF
jgi:hypothetical protein